MEDCRGILIGSHLADLWEMPLGLWQMMQPKEKKQISFVEMHLLKTELLLSHFVITSPQISFVLANFDSHVCLE